MDPQSQKIYTTPYTGVCPGCNNHSPARADEDREWYCISCGAHKYRKIEEKLPMSDKMKHEHADKYVVCYCSVCHEPFHKQKNNPTTHCQKHRYKPHKRYTDDMPMWSRCVNASVCETCGTEIKPMKAHWMDRKGINPRRHWCKVDCWKPVYQTEVAA